jgi:radical SAM protein with 4Fe4S-binding SPASM domain
VVDGTKKKIGKLSRISCSLVGGAFDLALSRFPNTVRIETTNACNAKCVICPHRQMHRPVCNMDDALYEKIIDECSAHNCGNIHLHNFGEPLLDRNLAIRVRYAKEKGIKRVAIFSNGSLLTAEKANELIDAGLDQIKVSFDGATSQEFEQIRFPLKFDTVIENIKELVRIRNLRKSPLKIKVACCSTSDKNETMRSLENCVDGFSFGKVHNWSDSEIDHAVKSTIRKPCSRVWQTFTVLSDGKVALCCLDYEGQVILGDVNKTSISEIWKNESYREIRFLHKRARQDQIVICKNCTKSFW